MRLYACVVMKMFPLGICLVPQELKCYNINRQEPTGEAVLKSVRHSSYSLLYPKLRPYLCEDWWTLVPMYLFRHSQFSTRLRCTLVLYSVPTVKICMLPTENHQDVRGGGGCNGSLGVPAGPKCSSDLSSLGLFDGHEDCGANAREHRMAPRPYSGW